MASHILFFGPLPPYEGGIALHSSLLTQGIERLGVVVERVNWQVQYPPVLYKGTKRRLSETATENATLVWWNPVTWQRLAAYASEFDAVVFPYVTPFHALPQRMIASRATRALAVVHNALPHESILGQGAAARYVLNACDALLVHGKHTEVTLRRIGVTTPTYEVPMPSLSGLDRLAPAAGDVPQLLMFGHMRAYKGVDVAIRSVRALLDEGVPVRLTLAGRFWISADETRRLIDDLGLGHHVQMRDEYIPDADLETYLSACSLVLAPYVADTLSAVVPTALAAGRPVIASAVEGILQQVRPGVDAITVRPRDHVDLARGIVAGLDQLEALTAGTGTRQDSWLEVARTAVRALDLVESRRPRSGTTSEDPH